MKRTMLFALIFAAAAALVTAPTTARADVMFRPATAEEKAAFGATHVATLKAADLTGTATNTVSTNTLFTAAAGKGVELVLARLKTAFAASTGATNTESLAVTVGDATSDAYLASMQLATDSTPVYLKWGRTRETYTTQAITNINGSSTNVYTVLTGTAENAQGRKYYTTATAIKARFTPSAEHATGEFDSGEVDFYFKVY